MSARLVAVGHVRAPYPTLDVRYALSDPAWKPVPSHDFEVGTPEPDPSDWRKQQIESEIAGY